MNLFILDTNPQLCAQYHSDVHVNKMATECGQIITAAIAVVNNSYDFVPGKTKMVKKWRHPFVGSWGVSHPYHPATQWCAQSLGNFGWTMNLWLSLCGEWSYRFQKTHGSYDYFNRILGMQIHNAPVFSTYPNIGKTPYVIAFNREKYADCIVDDVVQSYRNYYIAAKLTLPTKGAATWTRRDRPHWLPPISET